MPSPPAVRRRFGQHFLEPAWVAKVVAAIDPRPGDVFVEVGSGRGGLTTALAGASAGVVAVEIDRDLAASLSRTAPDNLLVATGDILEADLAALVGRARRTAGLPDARARLVGNLPYNVASPILFAALQHQADHGTFHDAVLMLQREVIDRIVARPGSRDYGVLSILTQLRAEAKRLLALPPGAFRPRPRVASALVRLAFRPPVVPLPDPGRFEALVRGLFTRRRKMLVNALKPLAGKEGAEAATVLAAAGLDGRRRAETLDLAELARLAEALNARNPRAVL